MICCGFLPNHRYALMALPLLTLIFTLGCSSQVAPLKEESLKNAEYQGIYPEPVKLSDGRFEGKPFEEEGTSRPMVVYIEPHTFGDLDGDGVEDAAVLLVENSGGSGSFIYLAAVLNQNGNPANQATTLLGDRVQVLNMSIQAGEIQVKMLAHGPDDPLCCPSQAVQTNFILEGKKLVPVEDN